MSYHLSIYLYINVQSQPLNEITLKCPVKKIAIGTHPKHAIILVMIFHLKGHEKLLLRVD